MLLVIIVVAKSTIIALQPVEACTTALCAQNQTKNNFENIASQRFQNCSCGSFDWKLLYHPPRFIGVV
jgi:hypothetical protein